MKVPTTFYVCYIIWNGCLSRLHNSKNPEPFHRTLSPMIRKEEIRHNTFEYTEYDLHSRFRRRAK